MMGKRAHSKPSFDPRLPVYQVISGLEDPKTIEPKDGVGEGYGRQRDEGCTGERERKEICRKMNAYSQPAKGKKQRSPKGHKCKKKTKSKKSHPQFSPDKLNFAANFTNTDKVFDVTVPTQRIGLFASMREDIDIMKDADGESDKFDKFESMKVNPSDNPTYEDPRDVLDKRRSKPRSGSDSSKMSRGEKAKLKEQKKKLADKYESLIIGLMDRCEDNMTLLGQKQSQLQKMKEKLKLLLAYNEQFAEENEQLRRQQSETSARLAHFRDVALQLETRNRELEERLGQLERPCREEPEPEVKLVEICMACNTSEITLHQVEQRNVALQRDMTAMKDVIYRLNIQLSRYQEKLRASQNNDKNHENITKDALLPKVCSAKAIVSEDNVNYSNIFESLNNANLHGITASQAQNTGIEDHTPDPKNNPLHSETSADLNANALAPLFEAYQDSIREKDNLILDYEKQFTNLNQKMKQLLHNNKALTDQIAVKSDELNKARESLKRAAAERESAELDKAALAERTEKAEIKLKEVYELYEDKVAAMSRDYETVHGEYFACRHALARAENRLAELAAGGVRTVPADLHERSLHDLKRLFEELKYQYGVERDRREAEVARLRARADELGGEATALREEGRKARAELKAALKNVRLYRRAAVVFRARLRACAASANSVRRRRTRLPPPPAPLAPDMRDALQKVDRIKAEIQSVKATAYSSLAAVEQRMRAQQAAAARAADEHARDLLRAQLLLDHKEGIIRSLIERVADVEELRLNEFSSHRLQGIPTTPAHLRRQEGETIRQEETRRMEVNKQEDPKRQEFRRQDALTLRQENTRRPEAGIYDTDTLRQEDLKQPKHRRQDAGAFQREDTKRAERIGLNARLPQHDSRRHGSVRLVPAPGGYFQEVKDDRKNIGS